MYSPCSLLFQALELGENDPDRLRARQKQIDIGMNTEGFKALMKLGLSGRGLQVCFFPFRVLNLMLCGTWHTCYFSVNLLDVALFRTKQAILVFCYFLARTLCLKGYCGCMKKPVAEVISSCVRIIFWFL